MKLMFNVGNLFILGDSYSTFEGFMPDGHESYYSATRTYDSDVCQVNDTWWYKFSKETGATIVKNCSYGGTTICNTGYHGRDCSDRSFVARFKQLVKEKYFKQNIVDTFILFGGTNDSWANSPIGELMYSEWKKEDLFFVLPAFCYLLNEIKKNVPNAKVICILNTELKQEIVDNYKKACEKYQIYVLQLENIYKINDHPTARGMEQISEQLISFLNNKID